MKRLNATDADIAEFTNMARKVSFFSQMTVGLLEKIFAFVMLFEYKKGEKICKQGGPGDAFYLVYSGKLNVSIKKGLFSSNHKVASLNSGDFFGEMALLDRAPRTATVDCEEDSKVFVLLAEHFNEVAKGNPDFVAYMKSLAAARRFELNQQQ
ncbi:MAG: cyclic nucleotide-binding domain-containing protein [Elusimicrobiota bacterium]